MAKTRFIGCLHLGDVRLTTGLRKYGSVEEHDKKLITNWNSVVSNDDTVYIVGDVSMEDPSQYGKLRMLKGKKIVVMGNHDLPEHSKHLLEYVDGLCGMHYLELDGLTKNQYKVWVSHAPLHPMELSFVDFNIHAHIHHMKVPYSNVATDYWGQFANIESRHNVGYINVDAQELDFTPKTIEELVSYQYTDKFTMPVKRTIL